jgi:hypothetical protein
MIGKGMLPRGKKVRKQHELGTGRINLKRHFKKSITDLDMTLMHAYSTAGWQVGKNFKFSSKINLEMT